MSTMEAPDLQRVAAGFAGASDFPGFSHATRPEHAAVAFVYLLDDRWVLRARDLGPGTVEAFHRECRLLDGVRESLPWALPVPLPTGDGRLHLVDQGRLWTLHRALPGSIVCPWQALHREPVASKQKLITSLRALQDTTRGRFGEGDPGYLVRDVGERFRAIRDLLSPRTRVRVEKALRGVDRAARGFDQADLVFVHGDFHYGNLLVDRHQEVTGLLDLDWCRIGHPLEDLAYTAMMLLRDFDATGTPVDMDGIQGWYGLDRELRGLFADYLILYAAFDVHLFRHAGNLDRRDFFLEHQVRLTERLVLDEYA